MLRTYRTKLVFPKIGRADLARFFMSRWRTLAWGLFALAAVALSPSADQLHAPARGVHAIAQSLGTVGLLAWVVVSFMKHANDPSSLKQTAKAVFVGAAEFSAFMAVALSAICASGDVIDSLLKGAMEYPLDALTVVSGALVAHLVFRAAKPERHLYARDPAVGGGYAMARLRQSREPRLHEDIERSAVHEAGHLLLFAALPQLPADLRVEVLSALGPQDPYRGVVSFERRRKEAWTRDNFEWEMLMRRAGATAEEILLGARADGAHTDHQVWLELATRYLGEGFGEPFYAEAHTQAAVAHNREVLDSLQQTQQQALCSFLELNVALLRELTDLLCARKQLSRDDVEPYLKRVVFTAAVRPLSGSNSK